MLRMFISIFLYHTRSKSEGVTIGTLLMGAQFFAIAATDALFQAEDDKDVLNTYKGMEDKTINCPVSMRNR